MGQTIVRIVEALECKACSQYCSQYVLNACKWQSRCCDWCQCEIETSEVEIEHEDQRCCC